MKQNNDIIDVEEELIKLFNQNITKVNLIEYCKKHFQKEIIFNEIEDFYEQNNIIYINENLQLGIIDWLILDNLIEKNLFNFLKTLNKIYKNEV